MLGYHSGRAFSTEQAGSESGFTGRIAIKIKNNLQFEGGQFIIMSVGNNDERV
jgi:hypothetical protein